MIQECSHDIDSFDLEYLQHDLLDIMRNMNTDGHLRSVFFGRSETMTIKDVCFDGGRFSHVYFIDWDHLHAQRRHLIITVSGITDGKWNNGEGDLVIMSIEAFKEREKILKHREEIMEA